MISPKGALKQGRTHSTSPCTATASGACNATLLNRVPMQLQSATAILTRLTSGGGASCWSGGQAWSDLLAGMFTERPCRHEGGRDPKRWLHDCRPHMCCIHAHSLLLQLSRHAGADCPSRTEGAACALSGGRGATLPPGEQAGGTHSAARPCSLVEAARCGCSCVGLCSATAASARGAAAARMSWRCAGRCSRAHCPAGCSRSLSGLQKRNNMRPVRGTPSSRGLFMAAFQSEGAESWGCAHSAGEKPPMETMSGAEHASAGYAGGSQTAASLTESAANGCRATVKWFSAVGGHLGV